MVRVAKLDCEVIEKEAEIWEDDFLDSADPELIAQYKIEKREKAYQAKLAKEKEEAEKAADQSEAKKSTNENDEQDFQDVDLDQFSSAEEVGKLGLEHIKVTRSNFTPLSIVQKINFSICYKFEA